MVFRSGAIKMYAGSRGRIVWKKPTFLGQGGEIDADSYEAIGLINPLLLVRPVHTFARGEYELAIPLSKNRGFALRAYLSDWCGVLFFLSGLGFLPLCCSGVNVWLTVAAGVVLVLSGAILVALWLTGRRNRDIRLILGKHVWGSSDPATWHEDLLEDVVDPHKAHGADSFEEVAMEALEEKDWVRAMAAARLCVVLEDEARGEELTDEILRHPSVLKRLQRVRSRPQERKAAFGEPLLLREWVKGDLEEPIFSQTWGL